MDVQSTLVGFLTNGGSGGKPEANRLAFVVRCETSATEVGAGAEGCFNILGRAATSATSREKRMTRSKDRSFDIGVLSIPSGLRRTQESLHIYTTCEVAGR